MSNPVKDCGLVRGVAAVDETGSSERERRGVEYLQRAGQAAGYLAHTEMHLPTRVIADAVISGPAVQMGAEVRRSKLTAKTAKDHTTRAARAGVLAVWFVMNTTVPPKWELAVQSVLSTTAEPGPPGGG